MGLGMLPAGLSVSPITGIGYAAGAGGTVTQPTSKSTGVTLNTVCGQITMNAAALLAGTAVSFLLTNGAIAATDGLNIWIAGGAALNSYETQIGSVSAGACVIQIRNITPLPVSEAVILGCWIGKAVTA